MPDRTPVFLSLRSRIFLSTTSIALALGLTLILIGVALVHRAIPSVQAVVTAELDSSMEQLRERAMRHADALLSMGNSSLVYQALTARGAGFEHALEEVRGSTGLDTLTMTDVNGGLIARVPSSSTHPLPEAFSERALAAVREGRPVVGFAVISLDDMEGEGKALAGRARIDASPAYPAHSKHLYAPGTALVIVAAAPLRAPSGEIVGTLCGAEILNRKREIVEMMRKSLAHDERYQGRDVAIAGLFLDNVRIASSHSDSALGTSVTDAIYERVVKLGRQWTERAFILDDWYFTAYQPIREPNGHIIGMLGFGMLERRYTDVEKETMAIFTAVTSCALLLATLVAWLLSRSILRPLNALVDLTRRIAAGGSVEKVRLDPASPEVATLGHAFNAMVVAIQERDQQLRRKTNEKLARSDRLAVVGQLAAGVAHEINNPLGSILLFSRLIRQQTTSEGHVHENIDRIEKETKRCHAIVANLLDFARERPPKKEPVDANELVEKTLGLFEHQFMFHNVTVVRCCGEKLPKMLADKGQLQQVLVNLIVNAVDAMDRSGTITLATSLNATGECVEIAVADTGTGIAPDIRERIFDPFFTTKGVGHGTGLGLSVSYGIATAHGGELSVESTYGQGSTFTLSIPILMEASV